MTVCPDEDELLRFLDGELGAPDDARIVVHVEDCTGCHERLERLTRGRPEWGQGAPIGTVPDHAGRTPDQVETDVDERRPARAQPGGSSPTDLGREVGVTVDPNPVPGSTQELGFVMDVVDARDTHPVACGETTARAGSDSTADQGPSGEVSRQDFRPEDTERCPTIAGYDILQRLGEGGMGVVYKARHLGLNRLVALKMIRGGNQARSDHLARFRVEAESVARLRHPNIIQIYDIGEAEGLPFVALELLDGGSLGDRLAGDPQQGRLAATLMMTLARAVHVAHESGIIHRDLKPANVLYTSDDTPKITDFGLAKWIDSEDGQTQSGQIMGSPSYMAPEQARGHSRKVGPAADVYALGAILYEMLTGRPPFKGETPMETVRQVLDDDPVTPSRLVPRVPRDLETIGLKCLHKDPSRRYPTARAMADDLQRFLDGKPIEARRTPAWERGAKWATRRPWAAMAGASGVLAGVLTIIGVIAYERGQRFAEKRRQTRIDGVESAALKRVQDADAAGNADALPRIRDRLMDSLRDIAREQEAQIEPRLAQLNGIVVSRKEMVETKLAAIESQQAEQARKVAAQQRLVAAQQRLATLRALRNETQLRDALPLSIESDRRSLRAVATAALMVYAKDPKAPAIAWTPDLGLADGLVANERAEVIDGCFDLLMLLSQAVDQAEGLKFLDHAARLRPELTPAYHARRAACLGQAGDNEGRVREEGLARALKPATASDHLLVGREHVIRKDFHEAIRSLKTAIRLDPSQLGPHLWLARADFQSDRFREAEISLNTCIGDAPDLLGLYLFRAVVYREEAAAIMVSGDRSSARRLEAADAFANADADFRRVLDRNPSPDYRYAVLVNRGVMYFQVGRLDESITDLESAVRMDPGPFEAHVQLFHVRRRQGRSAQAAAALDRAIERRPDRADLFRARALLVTGSIEADGHPMKDVDRARREAALRDWERAIRLQAGDSPQKAEDHAERGRLLFMSGQSEAALTDYDTALKMDPGNRKALRLRASALLALERYDEVLAACDASLTRDRPSVDLLEVRGLARLERKDFGGAIDDYTVALSMVPGSAALHDRRGWAYLFSDAFRLALADFDAAVRLDSRLAEAYGGRALARVGLGEWREALVDAEDAVRLAAAPRKHRAYFNAARVHAHALRFAGEDVSRHGEAALAFYRRIRGRASALLLESARQLPPRDRAAFWRDVVASDPALKPFLPGRG